MHAATSSQDSRTAASRRKADLGVPLGIRSESVAELSAPRAQFIDIVMSRPRVWKCFQRFRERLKAIRCIHVDREESPRNLANPRCARIKVSCAMSLCVGVVAQLVEGDGEDLSPVVPDYLLKGGLIAPVETADKLRVPLRGMA